MTIYYNIAEFRISSYQYIFFLSADRSFLAFGDAIVCKPLAVTAIEKACDCLEIPNVHMPHKYVFSFNSIILVICYKIADPTDLLRAYQQVQRWFRSTDFEDKLDLYSNAMVQIFPTPSNITIVAIPDAYNKEKKIIINAIGRLIHSGAAQKMLVNGSNGVASLGRRIEEASYCQATIAGNTIVIDPSTLRERIVPLRELHNNIFRELQRAKLAVASVEQNIKTQKVLREISLFRKKHGQYHNRQDLLEASEAFKSLGKAIYLIFTEYHHSPASIETITIIFDQVRRGQMVGPVGQEMLIL